MKLKLVLWTVAFSVLLFSCSDKKNAEQPVTSSKPTTNADTIGYALGYDVGHNFLKTLTDDSINVNLDYVFKGIQDGLSSDSTKLIISQEQMTAAMQALQVKMQEKQAKKQAEEQEKYEKRKKTAKEDGEKFLAANKTKEGVKVEKSGLQYKVLKTGKGEKPKSTDVVKFHIVGKFIDGEEFQSTYNSQAATAPLDQIQMLGLNEALSKMNVGSKWEVVMPPSLAYKDADTGVIPPNSVVIFEIELLSIEPPMEAPQQPTP